MDASADRARSRMYHLACHLQQNGRRCESGVSPLECRSVIETRRDGRVWYARIGAMDCGPFMRPAEPKEVPAVEEPKPKCSKDAKAPCDAKPAQEKLVHKKIQSSEAPLYARSIDTLIHIQSSVEDKASVEWSPRMEVVESETEHVVTIELPGISVESIRVEIDRGRLIVTGSRSWEWWRIPGVPGITMLSRSCSQDTTKVYRRDLSYGPCRAVWALPRNANCGEATAEFIDGFLRVVIPKTDA